jgi:hypothetical protein
MPPASTPENTFSSFVRGVENAIEHLAPEDVIARIESIVDEHDGGAGAASI